MGSPHFQLNDCFRPLYFVHCPFVLRTLYIVPLSFVHCTLSLCTLYIVHCPFVHPFDFQLKKSSVSVKKCTFFCVCAFFVVLLQPLWKELLSRGLIWTACNHVKIKAKKRPN